MKPSPSVIVLATAIPTCAAMAAQQPTASPPAFPTTDPQHLQEGMGRVERFTMTPQGQLDGFLFEGGVQVHVPPRLSAQLGAAVRPGDTVFVEGYRSPAAPVILASSVTDAATNRTVVDHGPDVAEPSPPLTGPPVEGARRTTLTDKVERTLYDPEGAVEGAVMQNGAILRLEPQTSNRAETLLTPGRHITTQGWKLSTPFGWVIAAEHVRRAAAARK